MQLNSESCGKTTSADAGSGQLVLESVAEQRDPGDSHTGWGAKTLALMVAVLHVTWLVSEG